MTLDRLVESMLNNMRETNARETIQEYENKTFKLKIILTRK